MTRADLMTMALLRHAGKARRRSVTPRKPGTFRMYEYEGFYGRLMRKANSRKQIKHSPLPPKV